jgi:hypothetical protein
MPGTVAIANDASDTLYLLDYRADRDRPAFIEVEAGSLCFEEIVRHGASLEAALRSWSGLDAARQSLLSCLVARADATPEAEARRGF